MPPVVFYNGEETIGSSEKWNEHVDDARRTEKGRV